MVSEIRFFKRRRTWTICENCVYLYFIPPVIFSSIFKKCNCMQKKWMKYHRRYEIQVNTIFTDCPCCSSFEKANLTNHSTYFAGKPFFFRASAQAYNLFINPFTSFNIADYVS